MTSLTDHFLIAMPSLSDTNFQKAVVYVCEHNTQGTIGLVINDPLQATVEEIFTQVELSCPAELVHQPIMLGGPVEISQVFVLHQPIDSWHSSLVVNDNTALTTSKDILEAFSAGMGPERHLISLGYSGWGPGQLEKELSANAWLHVPAKDWIIYDCPPEQRWQAAAKSMGVDIETMSAEIGHA